MAVIPIIPAAVLLEQRSVSLSRLLSLSGTSPPLFSAVYEPLLVNLAAHIQQLPDPIHPERDLLDRRLRHVECALARRRGYFLPLGATPERIAREADVWTYAVFSAALLRGLEPDLRRLHVTLYGADQRPLPATHIGWMGLQASGACAYHVRQIHPGGSADATLLHVAGLMPTEGLCWLWREPTVLSCWLQALSEPAPPPMLAPLLVNLNP